MKREGGDPVVKISNNTEYVVCLKKDAAVLELGINEAKELTGEDAVGVWTAEFFTGKSPKSETSVRVEKSWRRTTVNVERITRYSAATTFECTELDGIRLIQKDVKLPSIVLPGASIRSVHAMAGEKDLTKETILAKNELASVKRLLIFKLILSLAIFLLLLAVGIESISGLFHLFGLATIFAPMSFIFAGVLGLLCFYYFKSFLEVGGWSSNKKC